MNSTQTVPVNKQAWVGLGPRRPVTVCTSHLGGKRPRRIQAHPGETNTLDGTHYRYVRVDAPHFDEVCETHQHEFYEIALFHQGDCAFTQPGRDPMPLNRGDVLVMAPETRHGYRLGQGVWWTDVYLLPGWLLEDLRLLWDMEGLVRRLLAHVLFRIPFENGYIHIRTANGETTEWEREIRAMEEESLRAEPCLATVNGCFLKIMGLLNRAYLRDRPDAPAAPPALWRAAANIESLLRSGAPFEPAQLAQSMGVSQRTLERLFRKTTGLTPVRYYQRRRIDRARRLLADPERSVTGIAYELGFADAAHFSRVFNRHAGCAPSAYRTEQLTARRQAAQAAR